MDKGQNRLRSSASVLPCKLSSATSPVHGAMRAEPSRRGPPWLGFPGSSGCPGRGTRRLRAAARFACADRPLGWFRKVDPANADVDHLDEESAVGDDERNQQHYGERAAGKARFMGLAQGRRARPQMATQSAGSRRWVGNDWPRRARLGNARRTGTSSKRSPANCVFAGGMG